MSRYENSRRDGVRRRSRVQRPHSTGRDSARNVVRFGFGKRRCQCLTALGLLLCLLVLSFLALYVRTLLLPGRRVVVSVSGVGAVTPQGTLHRVLEGDSAIFTAMPVADSGFAFSGWQGDVVSSEAEIRLRPETHMRIAAHFAPPDEIKHPIHTMTVAHLGSGKGTTNLLPGRYLFRERDTVLIQATPQPGSFFGGWQILSSSELKSAFLQQVSFAQLHATLEMQEDVVAAAFFSDTGFVLHLSKEGQGRITPVPGDYALVSGTEITLLATPEQGCRLKCWIDESGAPLFVPEPEQPAPFSFSLDRSMACHAVFESALRTLAITVDGAEYGSVALSGNAAAATSELPYGSWVELRAQPRDGSCAFAGWYGADAEDLSPEARFASSLRVRMTEHRTITARFVPAQTTLTLTAFVDGEQADAALAPWLTLTPGPHGFTRDDPLPIEIAAMLQSAMPVAFSHWRGDLPSDADARALALSIPKDQSRSIAAEFIREQAHALTIAAADISQGTVMPGPGTYRIAPDRQLLVQADVRPNHYFAGWSVQRASKGLAYVVENPLAITLMEDTVVEARFAGTECVLEITSNLGDAMLTPAPGIYRLGINTPVDLNARPPEGYEFYHWASPDGALLSEDAHTRITLDQELQYCAVFGKPRYQLTVSTVGEGKGSVLSEPGCNRPLPPNTWLTLRAVPDADSVFARWSGDIPAAFNPTLPEQVLFLDRNKQVTAKFEPAEVQLELVCEGLPDGILPIMQPRPGLHGHRKGDRVQVFAAPPPDGSAVFLGWSGGLSGSDPAQEADINENMRLVARFASVADAATSVSLTIVEDSAPLDPLGPGIYRFMPYARLIVSCRTGEQYFDGFTGDFAGHSDYKHLDVVLDGDKSLGARLADVGGVLTLLLDHPDYGMIWPAAGVYRFSHDVEIELRAVRTSGAASFLGWFDGNTCLSRHGRYRFHMPRDKAILAITGLFRIEPEPPELVLCRKH